MLVNQRGFIVESLRQLAQSNSETLHRNRESDELRCNNCSSRKSSSDPQNMVSFEQDRTLGRTFVESANPKLGLEVEMEERNSGRLCPMCEAVFPVSVSSEDFESHVMEHFNFEDSDTLVYVPQDWLLPHLTTFNVGTFQKPYHLLTFRSQMECVKITIKDYSLQQW